MKKKKRSNSLKKYFINLFYFIFLLFLIATSNSKTTISINNINTVKGVEYSKIEKFELDTSTNDLYTKVFSIQELNLYKNQKVEFIGTLTAYGPDCVGCSGIVSCYPYQNVNNNIYYEDLEYGKIRILAADNSIPCGSIIKISNYEYIEDDFYGIVLDRGSSINGLTMDLLYESENLIVSIGRQYDIDFKIERWGF